jgi:hypothetical protein
MPTVASDLCELKSKVLPHLTQWAPSKLSPGQEAGCFSGCFCTPACVSFMSLPILPLDARTHRFGLRLQLSLAG